MISVIIPAYNEEKGIVRVILSILPQISILDEILVICSGCTDHTLDEVMKVQDNRIRIIIQRERKGKASAINLAVNKAIGEIIVQTDSDVELDKDAIENILYPLYDPDCVAVSGHPVPVIPEGNLFYEWTKMSYRKMHELRVAENKEGKFWHLSGYLLAFKKEAFDDIPFAKGAVDARMALQFKEKGKIAYAADAIVYVKAPTNVKDFIAQKSRVRAGYMNLPEKPRTAGSEIAAFPSELMKIKIWRWPQFCYCAVIYAYSWIKAKFIKGKSLDKIWKIPESTK